MDDEKNKDNNTSEENINMEDALDNTSSLEEDSSQSVKNEHEEDIKAEKTHSTDNSSSSSTDLNKVKIRQVLMYRIKNCKPNFKKIIAFILFAVIFFGAGLFAGRGITRHKLVKNFNGKPAIQRKMQKGFGRNRDFKINGGNKTKTPAQGQTQN